jgi:hypothetical protein
MVGADPSANVPTLLRELANYGRDFVLTSEALLCKLDVGFGSTRILR